MRSGAHDQARALCERALALDAHCTAAMYVLGVLALEHGQAGKALKQFDSAIAEGESDSRVHAQRAKALAWLRRLDEARAAADQAASLQPTDALTLDTIGVVFSRAGFHERAIGFFEQAAALEPHNASFQYNLAASQQFSGRFADAERSYRAALALKPDLDSALSAIPHLAKQSAEKNLIPELEAAFAYAGDHVERRLRLGHALAKTYEDIGDYAAAFAWFEQAKTKMRAQTAYDSAQDRAVFAAAARTSASVRSGYDTDEPVFVIGLPRTGTTLVDRILSSHRDVISAGELGAFSLLTKRLAGTASKLVLDAETLDAARSIDMEKLGRAYLDSTRPRTGSTPRFVDKMPLNFFYAGLIHQALPNARIICLRRHPMDSCLSNYRQLLATSMSNYGYSLSLEDAARYYIEFDKLIAHWRATLPANRFTEVWYEHLVGDLETEAQRLIDFIGLDWDPNCLAFHQNAAPVATASSVQVRSPLYSSSIGRWRRYGAALDLMRRVFEEAGVSLADVN